MSWLHRLELFTLLMSMSIVALIFYVCPVEEGLVWTMMFVVFVGGPFTLDKVLSQFHNR